MNLKYHLTEVLEASATLTYRIARGQSRGSAARAKKLRRRLPLPHSMSVMS